MKTNVLILSEKAYWYKEVFYEKKTILIIGSQMRYKYGVSRSSKF